MEFESSKWLERQRKSVTTTVEPDIYKKLKEDAADSSISAVVCSIINAHYQNLKGRRPNEQRH
jgi:hypothetical protein